MKLEVKNIKKSFGDLLVLDDISLSLSQSESVSILGVSGCGKSTLFNILSGLETADKGEILKDGANITGISGKIGYMQQKDLLLPWLNVIDNICLPYTLKGIKKDIAYENANKYLKLFGLLGFEKYYPDNISGGMRQRASLLRTFLFSSDIILLDEPFSNLDSITKNNMYSWFKDIQSKTSISTILVTHDIDESLLLSDTIYIMSNKPAQFIKKIKVLFKGYTLEDVFRKQEYIDAKIEILKLLK